MSTLTRRQLIGLVVLTLMWGLNWPVMKLSLREIEPLHFRAVTMALGALALALFFRARGVRMLGTGLWKGVDRAVIAGLVVNGSWKVVGWVAGAVRRLQSGYLYHYALVMILGIFVLMTYFVWLNK